MTDEVPTSDNTLTVQLEEEVPEAQYDVYGNRISSTSYASTGELSIQSNVIPSTQVNYVSPTVKLTTPSVALDKKIIAYDTETTGVNPWDYRLLVCSFWDLSKPISEMVTFSGWDEQKLTQSIADYLNSEKPDSLVQYNNGFDERALLTRFMLYQIKVSGWNSIYQEDVMDILKKGTTKNITSSQAVGTEEQWFQYFFGQSKPYTIEECFEGVRNGDLTRLILRNRTCVESEGSIYLLFRTVTDIESSGLVVAAPTAVNVEESQVQGICMIKCPTCNAENAVPCNSKNNQCAICLGNLPDPTSANILKEQLRQFDFSKVGLTAAQIKALTV